MVFLNKIYVQFTISEYFLMSLLFLDVPGQKLKLSHKRNNVQFLNCFLLRFFFQRPNKKKTCGY